MTTVSGPAAVDDLFFGGLVISGNTFAPLRLSPIPHQIQQNTIPDPHPWPTIPVQPILRGKSLVIAATTGVYMHMHTHCVELLVDQFFEDLAPGSDPSHEDLATFAFPEESVLYGAPAWQVNMEIVSDRACLYSLKENFDYFLRN